MPVIYVQYSFIKIILGKVLLLKGKKLNVNTYKHIFSSELSNTTSCSTVKYGRGTIHITHQNVIGMYTIM